MRTERSQKQRTSLKDPIWKKNLDFIQLHSGSRTRCKCLDSVASYKVKVTMGGDEAGGRTEEESMNSLLRESLTPSQQCSRSEEVTSESIIQRPGDRRRKEGSVSREETVSTVTFRWAHL